MGAIISDCGQYRYQLTRDIPDGSEAPAVFVMLNPSTADAMHDDPTIRRCMGFAKSWGASSLIVANLYALRSTDPKALWTHPDPVGPENNKHLAELARKHFYVVCAWGANARPDRVRDFLRVMEASEASLWCLGETKAGAPRHPLYLRRDAKLLPWSSKVLEGGE